MRTLSSKERCILELLSEHGETYGLALVAASGGELRRGTVYLTLARMEEKGLVASYADPAPASHSGLPRRLYRPTALGLRCLEATRVFAQALGARAVPAARGAR